MLVRRTQGDADAVPFFEDAIRKDPGFALAYARLGTVFGNIGRREEAEAATRKAFELRERVSERERLYIEGRYHSVVTEDVGKAIETYRLLIATYPDDYAAHTNLGNLLKDRGDVAEAMSSLREAVRLAPEQPTAWLNLAFTSPPEQRARRGSPRIRTSIELQDSVSARNGLYAVAIVSGDEALAAAQVEAVRGRRDEVDLLPARVGAAAYQGRFREGAELVDLWQRRMEQSGRGASVAERVLSFAINEALVGFGDRARRATRRAEDREEADAGGQRRMARPGRHPGGPLRGAGRVSGRPRRSEGVPDQLQYQEPMLRALVALASGEAAEAVRLLEPVTLTPRFAQQVTAWSVANHRLGRHETAIQGLQWLAGPPMHLQFDASLAFVLHALADSQEAAGRAADAQRTRQRLAELWKGADDDVPMIDRGQTSDDRK